MDGPFAAAAGQESTAVPTTVVRSFVEVAVSLDSFLGCEKTLAAYANPIDLIRHYVSRDD